MGKGTILIVDDDLDMRLALDIRLGVNGYDTVFAADAISAVAVARRRRPDLVILDLHSTPIIKFRMKDAENLEEVLFIQMTLGDDRAVRATYVNGSLAYECPPVS